MDMDPILLCTEQRMYNLSVRARDNRWIYTDNETILDSMRSSSLSTPAA